jgi:subtilisin family serine protease
MKKQISLSIAILALAILVLPNRLEAEEKQPGTFLLLEEVDGKESLLANSLLQRSVVTLYRFGGGESPAFRAVEVPPHIDSAGMSAQLLRAGLIASSHADTTRFNPWMRKILDSGHRAVSGKDLHEEGGRVPLLIQFQPGIGLLGAAELHRSMGATFLRGFGEGSGFHLVEVSNAVSVQAIVEKFRQSLLVAAAFPLASTLSEKELFSPDTIMVQFAESADQEYRELFASVHQLEEVRTSTLVPGLVTYRVNREKRSVQSVFMESKLDPKVSRVSFDFYRYTSAVPNDPLFADGSLWGLFNEGQNGGLEGMDISAQAGWERRVSSDDVIIAVIDTGVRYTHEDIAANMWRNTREIPNNGFDDDRNGYVDDIFGIDASNGDSDPNDDEGHGTFCAGITAAVGNNGLGITGVAWKAKIMALKAGNTSGVLTGSATLECLEYAVNNGASVVNASYGGPEFSTIELQAYKAAGEAGVVIFAAAGNSRLDSDRSPSFPANYALPNVVAVASFDRQGGLSSFSNFGITVALGAPGSEITSLNFVSDSSYDTDDGTSFATPYLVGIYALLKAQYPSAPYLEILHHMMTKIKPVPGLEGKTARGGVTDLGRALGESLMSLDTPRNFSTDRRVPLPDLVDVTVPLEVSLSGTIGVVSLNVDIRHSFLRDLTLSIESPSGKIHAMRLGDSENLSRGGGVIFQDYPLWLFTGENSSGTWKLRIVDSVAFDTGVVNSWSLDFRTVGGTAGGGVAVDTTPRVAFHGGIFFGNEESEVATLFLGRTGSLALPGSVIFSTASGTAIEGVDFESTTDEVRFAANQQYASFNIRLINDDVLEGAEFFTVSLSDPLDLQLGYPTTAVVFIPRNDLGFFEFEQAGYTVVEGQGVLRININRRAYSAEPATVDFFTSNGTAQGGSALAGGDFDHVFKRVLFFPGVNTVTVEVPIHSDGEFEMDETFFLHLVNPTNGSSLGNPRVVPVTIQNAP